LPSRLARLNQPWYDQEIDVIDLDTGPIAKLSDELLREVVKAIGHVFDSDCEPN
jgi:hypothetical protein